ncbi:MAG: RecX family transcriptional regulator [Dehalococcoidia bacterium]
MQITKNYPKIIKIINRKRWTKDKFRKELTKQKIPKDKQELIISEMEEYDIINDKTWAITYMEKGNSKIKGNKLIRQELTNSGINQTIVNTVLKSRNEDKACIAAINYIQKNKETKKIYNYLVQRGFSYDIIQKNFDIY